MLPLDYALIPTKLRGAAHILAAKAAAVEPVCSAGLPSCRLI